MPSSTISVEEACRTLEIKVGATEAEIKASYKRLALRTHPDKNPNDATANKRFLAVSEAYKRLTDEEFSDDDEYDDYDEDDEDFDISEIFAFRMFERMFFEASSGGQPRRSAEGGSGNTRNQQNNRGNNDNGGVQFSFPGMGGGGCNCPDCRRRFGYEKTKPWREYVPKSQRTDIPKETVKEVDPSIHDNWLSDDEDEPKIPVKSSTSKTKSKKAQKRENAANEQRAQIERQERQAREAKSKEQHNHHQHHSHHSHHHDPTPEESHMHTNKVNKLKLKQEEERLKLEQERAKKNVSAQKKKAKETPPVSSGNQKKTKKQKDINKDKTKHTPKMPVDSDDDDDDDGEDDDDDSDLDIEEIATRMGITDSNNTKNNNTSKSGNNKTSVNPVKGSGPREGTAAEFTSSAANMNHKYKEQIAMLQEMGFDYGPCLHAIETAFGSVELAATMLLQNAFPEDSGSPATSAPSPASSGSGSVSTVRASNKKPSVSSINVNTKRVAAPVTTAASKKSVPNTKSTIATLPTAAPASGLAVNKLAAKPMPAAVKRAPVTSSSSVNQAPSYLKASTGAGSGASHTTKSALNSGINMGLPVTQTPKPMTANQMPSQLPPGFMGHVSKQKQQLPQQQQQQQPQQQLQQGYPRQPLHQLQQGFQGHQTQTQTQTQTQHQGHVQQSPLFPPQVHRAPPPPAMPAQELNRGQLRSNAPNFEYFNQQQQPSSSPNSQSSPVSMPNQAMPMPAQQQQPVPQQQQGFPAQQQQQQASGGASSKFFSLFAPEENDTTVQSVAAHTHNTDPLGLGAPSLSDLLLNSDADNANSSTMLSAETSSAELYPSIFDSMMQGPGPGGGHDSVDMNMSGLGLDMTGLGGSGVDNSSNTSLSSLLGGSEHTHRLHNDPMQSQSPGLDQGQGLPPSVSGDGLGMGSLLGDISSLIGGDTTSSATGGSSAAVELSLDNMLGPSSFLLDSEPLLSDSVFGASTLASQGQGQGQMAPSLHNTATAASIVKNGNKLPAPSNGRVFAPHSGAHTSANSSTFHSSPTNAVGLGQYGGMKIPSPGPSSPGSVTSSSSGSASSSSKCLYFFTSRGCRHGANCKFSHHGAGTGEREMSGMSVHGSSSSSRDRESGLKSMYGTQSLRGGGAVGVGVGVGGGAVGVGLGTSVGGLTLSKKTCMFYATPQGCKHGSACRFVHSNKTV